jgi:hypothetical protein
MIKGKTELAVAYFEKGLFETHCPKFVRDAAQILENIID